jgi:hypothetical protein
MLQNNFVQQSITGEAHLAFSFKLFRNSLQQSFNELSYKILFRNLICISLTRGDTGFFRN